MTRQSTWLLAVSLVLIMGAAACVQADERGSGSGETALSRPGTTQDRHETASDRSPAATSDVSTVTLPSVASGLEGGRSKVIITGRSADDRSRPDDTQLQLLVEKTSSFTEQTGIPVEYIFVPRSRDLLTRDCATDCSLDVVLLDIFEIPLFGANGWAQELDTSAAADDRWDITDMTPTVRAAMSEGVTLYGAPLTATSSFLMYRTDLLSDADLSLPAAPTWQQVADAARSLDSADNGADGICLQGDPSWDGSGAVFTSVLNTFGGTYWTASADGTIGGELSVDLAVRSCHEIASEVT